VFNATKGFILMGHLALIAQSFVLHAKINSIV
jgi:hypothetical protein